MILVADDNYDTASLVKASPQKAGLFASSFTDPLVTLEEFRSDPGVYDLVISDIRMPSMNGYELAHQVVKIKPDVKVILMSAFDYSNRYAKAFSHVDITRFIEKPILMSELRVAVFDILGKAPTRGEPNIPTL